jgi:hypothetical protein
MTNMAGGAGDAGDGYTGVQNANSEVYLYIYGWNITRITRIYAP